MIATVDPLLITEAGHTACLLGNEAIVRGALESGVGLATGYPGTPSSEVTDSFARIAASRGIEFEYAVNEKIALELAFAASLAGARSICAMKHLGLMVAGDPLSTIPYIGTVGGMVIVSAGDPGMHTSPNEQDQRHLGPMLHLPILDPSSPAEALEMTKYAFEVSEAVKLPVILRVTTRVAHGRATVAFGPLKDAVVTGFVRNPAKYVPVPANARRMRIELKDRIAKTRELFSRSPFVSLAAQGAVAVLATGASAAICRDLTRDPDLQGRFALWEIGAVYPTPDAALLEALSRVKRVLVVEELSPFLENAALVIAARGRLDVEILGKHSGHLPEEFELAPERVEDAVRALVGVPARDRTKRTALQVPPRPPSLCPGCPHRATYFAARAAFDEDQLFFNDIGCYTLGYGEPHQTADALLCMGAAFTLAAGVARMTHKRTVGFVGDSTFFHAGMPALLDAIQQQANVVAVVLDNGVTAMTGFQDTPGMPSKHHATAASIEDVARALGAKHVEVVDPYDLAPTIAAFKRAKAATGPSVIVARHACPVHEARESGRVARPTSYAVDTSKCRQCGRDELGLQCDVPVTQGYERSLGRARSVRTDDTQEPAIAPCAARCPLSLCVQGYAGHIAAGEYKEALSHVLTNTVLPESVCRLCDRPCEDVCVRKGLDEPVAINGLKRFVVSWAARERPELLRVPFVPTHGGRVAVVGAGPAGLAAALDLRTRGYEVTLHDAAERPGGMLATGVPRYRLPAESLARDVARILEAGVKFVGGSALGRDVSLDELLGSNDAVVLAVGAWRGRRLTLAGESVPGAPGRMDALSFLRDVARGNTLPSVRRVAVIGGGNAAIDAARCAKRLAAGVEVVVACLEWRAEMPALRDEIDEAEREGIVVRSRVEPVRYEHGAVIVRSLDEESREVSIPADLVVVAIGQDPDLSFLATGAPALDRTHDGMLKVDPDTCCTSHPRIFAAGDVVPGPRTVTAAIAWGLRAAWGLDASLRGPDDASERVPPARPEAIARYAKYGGGFQAPRVPREVPPELAMAARAGSFDEVIGVFTEAQARAEASRCLMCGACANCRSCVDTLACPSLTVTDGVVGVDASLCIACGVCAQLCSDGAIGPGPEVIR